jgi:hypothetical protein
MFSGVPEEQFGLELWCLEGGMKGLSGMENFTKSQITNATRDDIIAWR